MGCTRMEACRPTESSRELLQTPLSSSSRSLPERPVARNDLCSSCRKGLGVVCVSRAVFFLVEVSFSNPLLRNVTKKIESFFPKKKKKVFFKKKKKKKKKK